MAQRFSRGPAVAGGRRRGALTCSAQLLIERLIIGHHPGAARAVVLFSSPERAFEPIGR